MSEEDAKSLKQLKETLDFGIGVNHKGLDADQTLSGSGSEGTSAGSRGKAFIQKCKAGWNKVRHDEAKNEAGKLVLELAKPWWQAFFSSRRRRQCFGG